MLRHPNVFANPFEKTNFHLTSLDNKDQLNNTKEMYQNDLEKVTKSKRRKKTNKARWRIYLILCVDT